MTASDKKKKARADFKKKKQQVGKKLVPQSATKTSYASKSISLPSQAIGVDKTGIPRTKRNQTFDDLVVQANHTNTNTRRDALLGFKELFIAHPHIRESHLSRVVAVCVSQAIHDERSVRKAFLDFFESYLPELSLIAVEPFHATLLLHLHAALSNIHSEIRLDALKLLDIYLRIFPNAVTSGWPYSAEASGLNSKTPGQQVLEAHLALLHIKHVGRGAALAGSSAPLSSAARAKVLTSLAAFLQAALAVSSSKASTDSWYYATAFNTPHEHELFVADLENRQMRAKAPRVDVLAHTASPGWRNSSTADANQSFLQPLSSFSDALRTAPVEQTISSPADVIPLIEHALRSTFLDSSALNQTAGATTESQQVQSRSLEAVLQIAQLLWRSAVASESDPAKLKVLLSPLLNLLKICVGHMCNEHSGKPTLGRDLVYCDLVALAILCRRKATTSDKGKIKEGSDDARAGILLESSAKFLTQALLRASELGLDVDRFSEISLSLWTCLTDAQLAASLRVQLLSALMQYGSNRAASSAEGVAVLHFIYRLLALYSATSSLRITSILDLGADSLSELRNYLTQTTTRSAYFLCQSGNFDSIGILSSFLALLQLGCQALDNDALATRFAKFFWQEAAPQRDAQIGVYKKCSPVNRSILRGIASVLQDSAQNALPLALQKARVHV